MIDFIKKLHRSSFNPPYIAGLILKAEDEIHFTGADLRWLPSIPSKTFKICGGYLVSCDLRRADIRNVGVMDAGFKGSNLSEIIGEGMRFSMCSFASADLREAYLRGASFDHCNFQGAALSGADLRGALISGGNFQGTLLTGARLDGLRLSGKITGADARGADLRGVVTDGSLGEVIHDFDTQFPGYMDTYRKGQYRPDYSKLTPKVS